MPKFFVKSNQIKDSQITILGEDVNHISKVLRMRNGEELQICNCETGENYNVIIENSLKDKIECLIKEKIETTHESNVKITVFQGLPKFDKMELIIQKNVEIGVCKIIPVIMERTVVKLDEKDKAKKVERWQKIAEMAAKQSERDIIPKIENIIKFSEILNRIESYDEVLVAYENEKENMLKNELNKLKNANTNQEYNIAILIGPEGGISQKEIEELKQKGAKPISLGNRILRTETASIVMNSNIMYELEQMSRF